MMHFFIFTTLALSVAALPASDLRETPEPEAVAEPKYIVQRSPLPTKTPNNKNKNKPQRNPSLSIPTLSMYTLSMPTLSMYTLSMPMLGLAPQKTASSVFPVWPSSSPDYSPTPSYNSPQSWDPPPSNAPPSWNPSPASNKPNLNPPPPPSDISTWQSAPTANIAPILSTVLITITRESSPSMPTNGIPLGTLVPQAPKPKAIGSSSSSEFDDDDW